MDEAGFDRAIVLLFGKFRYHCCNEDDRLGMIPAVFIPSLEIDGGYTHMGHRTKRFFQWSGKMGERF